MTSTARTCAQAVLASALGLAIASAGFALSGCDSAGSNTAQATGLTFSIDDMDLGYTSRDKDPSYDGPTATKISLGSTTTVKGTGATADASTVTITEKGTYILSGKATDTQVLVACADDAKVQLVLDGAAITCSNGPAIYVKSADKCFVTLAKGSKNILADNSGYTLTDDSGDEEPAAALFSKCDLTLNGTGKLTVNGRCNNGIGSKDDLVITGGNYVINAANDGLRGRDCVKVAEGTFDITSKQDAVKSNNDEDTTRGFVKIDGGTWTINAGDDAFHAETAFILNDGDIDVESCYEGYEGMQGYINGGTTSITASDDAVNAAGGSTSDAQDEGDRGKNFNHGSDSGNKKTPPDKPDADGQSASRSSDEGDGEKTADDFKVVKDGGTTAQDSGDKTEKSSSESQDQGNQDNGNPAGEPPKDSAPQADDRAQGNGGSMDADASCLIQINGGTITLNAQGDGIDSNGAIEVNGGDIVVYGPTSGGDGALDYGTSATVNGGSVIALGASGMAESFTDGSQAFALVNASGSKGDKVEVVDEDGKALVSTTAAKSYETAVISCSGMSEGKRYTLKTGSDTTKFTASTSKGSAERQS